MDTVEVKAGQPSINVFQQALSNVQPALEVKSRRVGGATYQVPIEVRTERRQALAIKWLIGFSRKRGERTMAQRLAGELLAASRGEGATVKKKDDTHRNGRSQQSIRALPLVGRPARSRPPAGRPRGRDLRRDRCLTGADDRFEE